ncbi:MAG: DUF935 family protein [Verrucomicrobia bacterium]|nr:DUF935 family protein [Verrucomicrobiota bacterium]
MIPESSPVPDWRMAAPAGMPLASVGAPVQAARKAETAVPDPGFILPLSRDRFLGMTARGWTPDRVEMVLRSALSGDHAAQWELFDLMEDTWPRLLKNLGEIKRAVCKMSWTVLPWAEDDAPPTDDAKAKAAAVSRALWQMHPDPAAGENGFLDTVFDLLDAWGKGTAVVEVDWEVRQDRLGQMIAPRATHWVHPNYYAWSPEGWIGMRVTDRTDTGWDPHGTPVVRFPDHKFLVGIARAKSGHPLGTALIRPLAWWWCASNFSAEWWLNFAQLFGVPIRWANYTPTAANETIARIQAMLQNMGSAAWAAFPEGVTLNILEAAKGAAGSNPQEALLNTADKLCDILILGQTLTTDVGASGSLALGKVHQGVRGEIISSAADWAAGQLTNQLVGSICELTWGNRDQMPELVAEENQVEDAKANADRDKVLLDAGVAMPAEWFRERHGIPHPQEGEEVIGGKQPVPAALLPGTLPPGPPGPPGLPDPDQEEDEEPAQAANARPEPAAQRKLAEQIAEDATGIERKWLGGTLPWFRALVDAARDPKLTDAEFEALLVAKAKRVPEELAPLLDTDAVREAMEKNMGAAVVNGAVRGWLQRPVGKKRK